MAWDSAERLALSVQSGGQSKVLLYATQLRPMMTAQLLGVVHSSSSPAILSMHGSSHGAVLAVQTGRRLRLVPLLYRD